MNVERTDAAAIVFSRQGGLWAADTFAGPDAVLERPKIGVALALGEIYAGIELTGEPTDDEES